MIFDQFTDEEVAIVEKCATVRDVGQDVALIQEGQPGESFMLILAGRVDVVKTRKDGELQRLAELGPLDVVGEMGFLGLAPRSATVIARTPCKVLEFDRSGFIKIVERHPTIGMKCYRGIARELGQRVRNNDDALSDTIGWRMGQGATDPGTGAHANREFASKLNLESYGCDRDIQRDWP